MPEENFSPLIELKGVSVHNLKKVDVTIEPGKLVVFSGVSGSGKSSLAFDTIYVEGQRRYIDSLSHQGGHLARLTKPDAEKISGIAPTIAIEQKLSARTPRSTVGTLTGIYDFLRVLFARIGSAFCPVSQESLSVQSREKIIHEIEKLLEKSSLILLSPLEKAKKGSLENELQELLSKGFTRFRIDGKMVDEIEGLSLDEKVGHDLDVVIDRMRQGSKGRVAESVQLALEMGKGIFFVKTEEEEFAFSETGHSLQSGLSYPPLTPQDFSFNHPSSMCPLCEGLGIASAFDLHKIINEDLSIEEDCFLIGSSYQTIRYGNIFRNLARLYDFKVKTPWKQLSDEAKKVILYGTETKWTQMKFVHPETKKSWMEPVRWQGVLQELEDRYKEAKSDLYRKKMQEFRTEQLCPSCNGAKIKPYPSACRLKGKTIQELSEMALDQLLLFFTQIDLTPIEKKIGEELVKEIIERLQFLIHVGLSYLSLNRSSPTLSGGESQRVRLASQIGAGLVGAIYVLDEPSIGLHPVDHHLLIEKLLDLRDLGNTLLVVEHDKDTILAADQVIDVGPYSGVHGGKILCSGTIDDLLKNPESITAQYLSGRKKIEGAKEKRVPKEFLTIYQAEHHNLQKIDVKIPLGVLTFITGVSGSGKSSLISDTLFPALSNALHKTQLAVGKHQKIEGIEHLEKVIEVDQSPIGRTPRSNPATYIKLFDDIRELYAKLPESKIRGFTPSHFSFNLKEGACSYCQGMGSVKIDLDFLEESEVECPQCKGKRFEKEILSVRYKGKEIAELLDTSVTDAYLIFQDIPAIAKKLETLEEVGLGYLKLGQPSTTLSGGEAQRVKLAKELVRPSKGKTIYLFDEPTTGLHLYDVDRLSKILQKLVSLGNSVLVIEHHLELIQTADWVIDLGPGPGIYGGRLLGSNSLEEIKKIDSPTAKALRGELKEFKPQEKKRIKASPYIEIDRATQNNLKSVSLQIPKGKISLFTGPSGSGKSSLAFDTIFAEGQRRYTETLSPYLRSVVGQLPKPKVESIKGLIPSIALEQKKGGLNPRSTVGTMTEIYDLLRLFYAHLGVAYCPESQEKIEQISKDWVVRKLFSFPQGEKVILLAPILFEKKELPEVFIERLNRMGYLRIRVDKTIYTLDEKIPIDSSKKQKIELVIDRLSIDPKNEKRIFEAVSKASEISDGQVIILRQNEEELFLNLRFAVEKTGKSYPPLSPQSFSFNHEQGMCLECQGLGITYGFHLKAYPELMELSLSDLFFHFLGDQASYFHMDFLESYFKKFKIDLHTPLEELSEKDLHLILQGSKAEEIKPFASLRWIGLDQLFANIARMGKKEYKEPFLPLMKSSLCPVCKGERLNSLSRNVKLEGVRMAELTQMELFDLKAFLETISLEKAPFLKEAKEKMLSTLEFLLSIGLNYLTLSRTAPTLSGGELQRIRLARQLGSGLTSCLYVLDEPTIGLHPHNNELLNKALKSLQKQGNTLLLVEHDPMTMKIADQIFDFGPKSGKEGGVVIAQGSYEEILKNKDSLTGSYLSQKKQIQRPLQRRKLDFSLKIENANVHTLKNLTVSFPKGAITCLTGISGAGKSSLMRYQLQPAIEEILKKRKKEKRFSHQDALFTGWDLFERLVVIDQSPIGLTSRADVGSFTEIMPLVRAHFALLPLAKAKGLQGCHFSPNHLRGMCRACFGLGTKKIDLQFLPSVRVECEACKGFRLTPLSLEVRYKGKNLGEVLRLNIQEALSFFSEIPKIVKKLKLLEEVGLSYLTLGQEIASLSGGELQRLRLAKELSKRENGKTLYLIDEPTIGLHFDDIAKLLPIFHRLADKKNSLIIIEHNVEVIAHADYIIDLGPDAGPKGGFIIDQGTPEEIVKSQKAKIAPYLQEVLDLKKSFDYSRLKDQ